MNRSLTLLFSASFFAMACAASDTGVDSENADVTSAGNDALATQLGLGKKIGKDIDLGDGRTIATYERVYPGVAEPVLSEIRYRQSKSIVDSVLFRQPGWENKTGTPKQIGPIEIFTLDGVALDAAYTYSLKNLQGFVGGQANQGIVGFDNGQIYIDATAIQCKAAADSSQACADAVAKAQRRDAKGLGSSEGVVGAIQLSPGGYNEYLDAKGSVTPIEADTLYLSYVYRSRLDRFVKMVRTTNKVEYIYRGGRIEYATSGVDPKTHADIITGRKVVINDARTGHKDTVATICGSDVSACR